MRGIDWQVARLGVAETRLEISQGHDLTQLEIHHLLWDWAPITVEILLPHNSAM